MGNVAGSAHFTEEGGAIALSSAVTVTDADDLDLVSATVSVTAGGFAGDVLAATGTASIGVSYDTSTETLTLTGSDTLAHYQQVLDGVTFNAGENPANFGANPTRTVTWTVNDGAASNATSAVTETVSITTVNDPPTLSGTANASFTEEAGCGDAVAVRLGVGPDDLNLASATVAITGALPATCWRTGTASIGTSYNSTSETLTLTGSDTWPIPAGARFGDLLGRREPDRLRLQPGPHRHLDGH